MTKTSRHIPTGIAEFDRTIGGGIVPGSTILLSKVTGAGATTLLMMVADGVATQTRRPVLFVSGEQSIDDFSEMACRIGIGISSQRVNVAAYFESIEEALEGAKKLNPVFIVLDSLWSIVSTESKGKEGSSSQATKVMRALVSYCKQTKTSAIAINRVTARNYAAGSVELEHLADTLLMLGYPHDDDPEAPANARILIVDKNRHGADGLYSYWQMTEKRMVAVSPKRHVEPTSEARH